MDQQQTAGPFLADRLAEALRLVDEAIVDASKSLDGAPDNPAVHRVGNGRAFTLRSSELVATGNWSVFFHDWVSQYRYARELLEARRFGALVKLLGGGSYQDPSHGVRSFAPQVIERIRSITGDLREAVRLTDAGKLAVGESAGDGAATARMLRPRRP